MATKVIKKEVSFCDECGNEVYVQAGLGCGIEHCEKCRRRRGYEYKHAVPFSGTGDGYFCNKCDKEPPEKVKELHQAYRRIQSLHNEEKKWHKTFEARVEVAESVLNALLVEEGDE